MDNSSTAWLTTIIAVYGAILATLSFIASIWLGVVELNRHKQKVSVQATDMIARLYDELGAPSESFIGIKAINVGEGPINIVGVGWLLSDNSFIQILNPYMLTLPTVLKERSSITFLFACRWLREMKYKDKIVGIFFKDEIDQIWKAKVTKRMLKKWINAKHEGWSVDWDKVSKNYYRAN